MDNQVRDRHVFDDVVQRMIDGEVGRQASTINLIASENYASQAVCLAQGSVLTNKYAEGYPGKRYYGGCAYVDQIERCAIERACALFEVGYANVQPHSGSQANEAVFFSMLKPGDTFLAMGLNDGGHLTHGAKVNFSGSLYQAIHYGVDPRTSLIDYDQVRVLAKQHQPKLIIAGFSAYSGLLDWAKFRSIADEVGALLLVDMAHIAGLVAAKVTPSPIPFADIVTTTTHKTLRGPRGGLVLARDAALMKRINFGVFPFNQGGPLMHVIAAKAIAFKEAMHADFIAYQHQVLANAKALVTELHAQGLKVVSGQTSNHQCLLDFSSQSYTGADIELALERAGISSNKNMIPGDKRRPQLTSGLRLGTAAITTRGCKQEVMQQIAGWIAQVCNQPQDQTLLAQIKKQVAICMQAFPLVTMPSSTN